MENTHENLQTSVLAAVDVIQKNVRNWNTNVFAKAGDYQDAVNDDSKCNAEDQDILQGCSEKCDEIKKLAAESVNDLKNLSNKVLAASSDVDLLSNQKQEITAEIKRVESLIQHLNASIDSLGSEEDFDEEQLNWLAEARINLVDLEASKQEMQASLQQVQELEDSVAKQAKEIADELDITTIEKTVRYSDSSEVLKKNIETMYEKATSERALLSNIFDKVASFFSVIKDKCAEVGSRIKSALTKVDEVCVKAEQLIENCPSNRQSMRLG